MKYWVLLFIGLIMALKLSINIWRIWQSGDRIVAVQKQLDTANKEQLTLQKQLTWVQSPEFVEKEAREKLGFGKTGEIIVIVPAPVETTPAVAEPSPNWKKWWDLYIGL